MGCTISKEYAFIDTSNYDELKQKKENIKKKLENFNPDFEIENEIDKGKLLCKFVEEFDKKLPLYILFRPESINYYKQSWFGIRKRNYKENNWKILSNIVQCDNNDNCDNCMKFFKNKTEFDLVKNSFIKNYDEQHKELDTKFLNDNCHVAFHGNEINPYVIYKKLKVKFDFYYIPLSIYNRIKTKVDLMKTVQILELLGPEKITVENKDNKKIIHSAQAGVNTGMSNLNFTHSSSRDNTSNINQGTTYSQKLGFYFKIDELIEFIANSKHIFMSREDYEKDFELRYLIRSRIKSFLKTYKRTLVIKKLSSLENKMQLSLNDIYNKLGMNFKYNNEKCVEYNMNITCDFYGVEEIALIDELPLDNDGYKIILDKYENNIEHAKKDIIKFVENYMEEKELNHVHNDMKKNNSKYKSIFDNIDSFNDIKHLERIIRYDVQNTLLNEEGFDLIRHKNREDYLRDIRVFIKRLLKENHIEEQYDAFLNGFPDERTQDDLFMTFDKLHDIQKRINKLLLSAETTSINRRGYTLLKSKDLFNKNNKKIFFKRFVEKHSLNKEYLSLYDRMTNEIIEEIFRDYDNIKFIQRNPDYYKIVKKRFDEEDSEKAKIEEQIRLMEEDMERAKKEKEEKIEKAKKEKEDKKRKKKEESKEEESKEEENDRESKDKDELSKESENDRESKE